MKIIAGVKDQASGRYRVVLACRTGKSEFGADTNTDPIPVVITSDNV